MILNIRIHHVQLAKALGILLRPAILGKLPDARTLRVNIGPGLTVRIRKLIGSNTYDGSVLIVEFRPIYDDVSLDGVQD